ncbi:MAG: hypothetical protein A2Y38_21600 [Spirochaetes bacterium GWB1_59_5]|nr:MAG: hypothetical protein A2Y38_21600 [Spirochaetes bacterium GWB1_59_5]
MPDDQTPRQIDRLLAGKELPPLTFDERTVLVAALNEYAVKGDSQVLQALWRIDFEERPPSPAAFLSDPEFMGMVCQDLYPEWRRDLIHVLSPENGVYEWVLDGAIGVGKTSKAVIALLYKMMLLFKMRNPQTFYGLLPGSAVVFALFNIYKYLADDTAYGTMMSYMQVSPYFREAARVGKRSRRAGDQYHEFPNNVGVTLGAGSIHALGQNVIGGLLDEANFRKQGRTKRAEQSEVYKLYSSTRNRITSRFGQPTLLCLASSANDEGDFTRAHKVMCRNDPHVYCSMYALYDVKPKYKGLPTFRVYCGDRVHPPEILKGDALPPGDGAVEAVPDIPEVRVLYERDITGAIREVSGRSVLSDGRFFESMGPVDSAADSTRENPWLLETVQIGVRDPVPLIEFFQRDVMFVPLDVAATRFQPRYFPAAPRYIHADLAENNCAAGLACVAPVATVEHESHTRLLLWVDFVLAIQNAPGDRICFEKIRSFIFWLRSHGLVIGKTTFDQYQSTDSINLLTQAGIDAGRQSVEKTIEPYSTLRNAYSEHRVQAYPHRLLRTELEGLRRVGSGVKVKVEKPVGGSKDIADSLAAASFTCMLNATGVSPAAQSSLLHTATQRGAVGGAEHPFELLIRRG